MICRISTVIGIFMLAVFMAPLPAGLCQQSDNEKQVYLQRLEAFLRFSFAQKGSIRLAEDRERQARELWNFTWEYPQSGFADDARFVVIALSSTIGKKDIAAMEQLVRDFPEGRLEHATASAVRDSMKGAGAVFWINLPYKQALILMRAEDAMFVHDYGHAVQYADRFIESLSPDIPDIGNDLRWAYKIKYISLQKMGRFEEAQATRERVRELFPGSEKFQ